MPPRPPSATTYLFYGVFITVPSLLIAASAHEKISPPLLGLDLISLRSRRGLLATQEGYEAITKISPEVWFLVRAELEDIVWIDAEHELVLSVQRVRLPLNLNADVPRSITRFNVPFKWPDTNGEDAVDTHLFHELINAPFRIRDSSVKVSSQMNFKAQN